MATSASARAAHECGGGGSGTTSPKRPATTVMSTVSRPLSSSTWRAGIASAQSMEKCGSTNLSAFGRLSQIWKSSSGFGPSRSRSGNISAVDDPAARGEPLHVALTEAGSGAERVGVIDVAAPHDGHRLEPAMRMLREPGHDLAVVHPPAVFALEVLTDVAGQTSDAAGPELVIAGGIRVVVMSAEEERIGGHPRKSEGPWSVTACSLMCDSIAEARKMR